MVVFIWVYVSGDIITRQPVTQKGAIAMAGIGGSLFLAKLRKMLKKRSPV
jgi:hypothetical protein